MSKRLVVGNWKMNLLSEEAASLAGKIAAAANNLKKSEAWIAPTLLSLPAVSKALKGSQVRLGAQNIHWADNGAFTGEVSASMLSEFGASFALAGHSERRHVFGESDELAARRAESAKQGPLSVIFCVGETLKEREAGSTHQVLQRQLKPLLESYLGLDTSKIILAYEPVWAIGTGKVAGVKEIEDAHQAIKVFWESHSDNACPSILYGGSVTPENFASILEVKLVSGGLVGGASLSFDKFAKLLAIAEA